MSVTFTFAAYREDPQFGTILWVGADCEHKCTLPEGQCEDAVIYGPFCCDHTFAAKAACGCEAFDVNMSNTNAQLVLERLGLPHSMEDGELAGQADPADILGRAMLGNVGRDDSGSATVEEQVPGCARMVYCGVAPGYFGERLDQLAALATEAQRRGVLVAWS